MGCIPAPRGKTTVNTTVMKEKTPEEKKSIVLAFCEQVFEGTTPGQSVEPIAKVVLQAGYINRAEDDTDCECIYMRIAGQLVAYLWTHSTEWEIDLFYKLLGLEARELREELEAEKAASAKLVEDLEAIKYQDEVNGKGWENDANSTYSRLCKALEAHKKGGTGK